MNAPYRTLSRLVRGGGISLMLGAAATLPASAQSVAEPATQIDPIFAKFNSDAAPGCG